MSKKILLPIVLLSLSLGVFAAEIGNHTYDPDNTLPEPVRGIQIVPDDQISGTEAMKKAAAQNLKEFNENGYSYSDSTYPRELLKIKYESISEIKENKKNTDPYDTHLKANASEIKLAFPFNGVPFLKAGNVIGFAPAGGYNNGWTGIKEFFTDNQLGTCSLTLYNISLSNGGARLGKSFVTYKVNKKPTTLSVEGNINSGFLYTVAWYDNTFIHCLECANMIFDRNITSQMIGYSQRIDKSLVHKDLLR